MFITVKKIDTKKIVAQVSVSDSEEAHNFFCQQYDHEIYSYVINYGDIHPAIEFAKHA